jgi:hypothetical protein
MLAGGLSEPVKPSLRACRRRHFDAIRSLGLADFGRSTDSDLFVGA